MRKAMVVLALFGMLAMVRSDAKPVIAQATPVNTAHQHDTAKGFHSIPIAVNGAETPEKIPDDIAYSHFVSVIAISSAATPAEVGRRRAILTTARLGQEDAKAIGNALAGVREQLAALDVERKQLTRETAGSVQSLAAAASIRSRQQTILREARYRVIGTISPDGARLLHEHIERRVKPRIVIYGDPRRTHFTVRCFRDVLEPSAKRRHLQS